MTDYGGKHLELVLADGYTTGVQLGKNPLGSGGDANIYPIAKDPQSVAKIYHDPDKDPNRQGKIRAMLEAPPDLPPITGNKKTYIQIAWPTGILQSNQGQCLGYVMPFVDLKSSTVLDNLLVKKIRKTLGVPEFYGFRVVTAANLASLVESLHAIGHHIIDLKPVNINVYTDSFYASLLDCDGLSIQGRDGKRYPAHQYTDGYIAPEALKHQNYPRDLAEDQDRFALAVIIFQLLNNGIHPYQGSPRNNASIPATNGERIAKNLYAYSQKGNPKIEPSPWSIHNYLEDDTRQLFDRAFGLDPTLRPSAGKWRKHLRNLTNPDAGLLKRCSHDPGHGMFSKGCGFCHLKKVRPKKVAPGPVKKTMGAQTAQAGPTIQAGPGFQTAQLAQLGIIGQLLQGMPGFNSSQPFQVNQGPQGIKIVQGNTVIQVGQGSRHSSFFQSFFSSSGSSNFPNFPTSQSFPSTPGGQIFKGGQPIQGARVRTFGTGQAFSARKRWPGWASWVVGALFSIVASLFFYRQSIDIHYVIRNNNESRFFDQVEKNKVPWQKLTSQDLLNAMEHPNGRILLTILENKNHTTCEYEVLKKLLQRRTEPFVCTYLQKVDKIDLDPDIISLVSQRNWDAVIECYLNKIMAPGVLNGASTDDFFAAVFLLAGDNMISRILELDADPDMMIPLSHDSDTFESLFALRTRIANYPGIVRKGWKCDADESVRKYYSDSFPIPGVSRIYDLQAEKSIIDNHPPLLAPNFYHKYAINYTVQPLIIATLKDDIGTIQTLIQAGADVDIVADNKWTILGLAQSKEAYQLLRKQKAASKGIDPFIPDEDMFRLSMAVKGMKKNTRKSYLKDVLSKAERAGSFCMVHELIHNYKIPFHPEKATPLINAYKSENPLMLAYYLKNGVNFESAYPAYQFFYKHIFFRKKNLSGVEYLRNFKSNQQLAAYYRDCKETRIGQILLKTAQLHRNRWGMAFVLEDHWAKWSKLHFAVLEDDGAKIKNMLAAEPDKIDQKDGLGRTPLALAIHYQCEKSYNTLVTLNPDLNAEDNNGYTPLMHAVSYGNDSMAGDLINKGAKLTSKSHPGCSLALTICLQNKKLADHIHRYLGLSTPYQTSQNAIYGTYHKINEAASNAGLSACEMD